MNDGASVGIDDNDRVVGRFADILEDCRILLAELSEAVDDHLGLLPEQVAWGNVADASRLLDNLRIAAFAAGIGDEPQAL